MDRRQELEGRLEALKAELARVEGSQTEVYSRIVGYYRSVRNWNAGKREEYSDRVAYGLPELAMAPSATPVNRPAKAARVEAGAPVLVEKLLDFAGAEGQEDRAARLASCGILVFTRKACPNCPPVADFIHRSGLAAIFVDVDGEDGLALARRHSVLATPTVLGLDGEGRESFRAYGIEEVRKVLPLPALEPC